MKSTILILLVLSAPVTLIRTILRWPKKYGDLSLSCIMTFGLMLLTVTWVMDFAAEWLDSSAYAHPHVCPRPDARFLRTWPYSTAPQDQCTCICLSPLFCTIVSSSMSFDSGIGSDGGRGYEPRQPEWPISQSVSHQLRIYFGWMAYCDLSNWLT
jgi:hypothetical protein